MADEKQEEKLTNAQYIEAINKLKENSVDKSEYEQLKAENQQLLESLINGRHSTAEKDPAPKHTKTEKQLREELSSCELNNLEYVKSALELREMQIERTGKDPFLPYGFKITPTQEDIDAAQRVADVLQDCVDAADGDSHIFTNELYRRIIN